MIDIQEKQDNDQRWQYGLRMVYNNTVILRTSDTGHPRKKKQQQQNEFTVR